MSLELELIDCSKFTYNVIMKTYIFIHNNKYMADATMVRQE